MKDKDLILNKLKEEIKGIEIIDTEDKILDRYYDMLHEVAEKYGFEANTTDFDYERLYPKDYEKIIAETDNDEDD